MSSQSLRSQNNIKAGIFVSVSLLIGLCVIFVLGDFIRLFGPSKVEYTVSYHVADGVGALGAGSFVKVGGIIVGEVQEVGFEIDGTKPLTEIDVVFAIPAEMAVRSDAKLSVESGLLSSDAWLSFSSLGTEGTVLEPGTRFKGVSMSMLSRLLGAEGSDSLTNSLASIESITERLEENGALLKWVLGHESAVTVDEAIVKFKSVLVEGESFLKTLNGDWENWSKDIDLLMAEAEGLSQAIGKMATLVNEEEGEFDRIVQNLDSTLASAAIVADKAVVVVDDVQVIIADLKANSGIWIEDISTMLANLTLSSQQLTQLLAEVTASPWRLLYRPTDKQYSQELIYEASRNFVFGAADLKAAAGSMQRLLEARGDTMQADDEQYKVMRQNLIDSADRYQRAQEQLMELLRGGGDGGK